MKILSTVVGCLTMISSCVAAADEADAVFVNGNIYTSDVQNPWASVVAVTGSKIVFVGNESTAF